MALLCESFAADLLTVEEFERRVDRAHSAATDEELEAVVADLPKAAASELSEPSNLKEMLTGAIEVVTSALDDGGLGEGGDPTRSDGAVASPRTPGTGVPAAGGRRKESENIVAVFGSTVRRGRWQPARRTFALALCGGAEIDLREVALPHGVTEISIVAAWGGVDIVVHPDQLVEIGGMAVFGGFDQTVEGAAQPVVDPDSPVLHVKGLAFMGGVDVKARYPGESEREAKRRVRRERKRRRLLAKHGPNS